MGHHLSPDSCLLVGTHRHPEASDQIPLLLHEFRVDLHHQPQLIEHVIDQLQVFLCELSGILSWLLTFERDLQVCNQQVQAKNDPLYCDVELILRCDELLLDIESISHLGNFIQFIEIPADFATDFDVGEDPEDDGYGCGVERGVESIEDVGANLHALACLYGLVLVFDVVGEVLQFQQYRVPCLCRRTNLY